MLKHAAGESQLTYDPNYETAIEPPRDEDDWVDLLRRGPLPDDE